MGSVLFIGDSAMNRAAVVDALCDFHVVEANDIDEAIEKSQESDSNFIAVIFDADHMENDTGLLLRVLREQSNEVEIKVIVLLSKDSRFAAEDVIQSGVDMVFVRPFDISKLQDYIESLSAEVGF